MKLEQNEKSMLFSETTIPDIFFSDYLPLLTGDYLKIYMYLSFLSKYGKDIKLNDLSKKLNLPLKTINDSFKFLEEQNLIIKKTTGYIIIDLQETALNNLYTHNLTASKEKIEQTSKNKSRAKAIESINNLYFQGIMSPAWYSDIDIWFSSYNFDEQVMIALFDFCHNKGKLFRNYVKVVAENWALSKVKTWNDLEKHFASQEQLNKYKKIIAKKLGKFNGLTEYEEAYIHNWIINFKYEMDIIEIALKRTLLKNNASFEYINSIISDWNERNLRTPEEVLAFIDHYKNQEKQTNTLKKEVKKANSASFDQRSYNDFDFLYSNNNTNI